MIYATRSTNSPDVVCSCSAIMTVVPPGIQESEETRAAWRFELIHDHSILFADGRTVCRILVPIMSPRALLDALPD